jgi:hypothetical protein
MFFNPIIISSIVLQILMVLTITRLFSFNIWIFIIASILSTLMSIYQHTPSGGGEETGSGAGAATSILVIPIAIFILFGTLISNLIMSISSGGTISTSIFFILIILAIYGIKLLFTGGFTKYKNTEDSSQVQNNRPLEILDIKKIEAFENSKYPAFHTDSI